MTSLTLFSIQGNLNTEFSKIQWYFAKYSLITDLSEQQLLTDHYIPKTQSSTLRRVQQINQTNQSNQNNFYAF